MFRSAAALRVVVVALLSAAAAHADPATQSSLPWMVQGTGPVARAGRTLFFGNTYGVAPLANNAQGIAVFSQGESVGESFDLAAGSDVYSAIPDGAGGWYAGGPFSSFGGLLRRGVVHILANGRVDPGFTADLNGGGAVFSMALNGSQLIIAGVFSTVNLVPRNGLAWVNAATGQVLAIAPAVSGRYTTQLGNTLFVAGTNVSAVNASTGAALPGFATAITGGSVEAMAGDGTSLYIGGSFTAVNGVPRSGLARIDAATGFLDPSWTPAVGNGGSAAFVTGLAVSSGALYVGGRFVSLAGQPRSGLGAVTTASGAATAWRADTDGGVSGLAVQAGAVYVTGTFTSIGGARRLNAAAVSASAPATVLPWDPSLIGLIRGVAAGSGRVAVVGSLNGWGIADRRGLSAIDAVTGELLPWAPNFTYSGQLIRMLVDGSRLIVAGGFTSVDGASRTNLAMFDLETQALLPFAPAINGPIYALAVANGVLYIGGSFFTVDSSFRLNLAAIDLASGQVLPWDPQADAVVSDIVVRGTGVIVGGAFTSLIGTNGFRTRIGLGEIGFDGAVTAFDANIASGTVSALATSGSTLFIGGGFSTTAGARQNAAAIDLTNGVLLPWNPAPNGAVQQFSINRGFVYLRGGFTQVGGVRRTRVARVSASDGSLSAWQLPFAPPNVYGIAAFDDGLLLNVASPNSALNRQNGMFLPEEAVAGLPGPPAEPSARVVGSVLSLTFGPPVIGPRPSSYLLEAGTGPALSNIGTIPLATTQFSIGGVPPGVYYVRVRAVGPAGVGAPSRELVFAVGAATCTMAPTMPAVPTTTVVGSSIVIDWRASPGSAPTAFTLLAGSSAGFANIATLPLGSGTTFATSGVPAGAYFVRVVASNACGQSAPSADALLQVGGAPGPPATPLQFTGTAASGSVSLSWITSTGATPTSHVLEAGSGPTLRNLAVVTLGPGTAFSTAGVPAGTYYLRVRAVNGAGISRPSGELILVVP